MNRNNKLWNLTVFAAQCSIFAAVLTWILETVFGLDMSDKYIKKIIIGTKRFPNKEISHADYITTDNGNRWSTQR